MGGSEGYQDVDCVMVCVMVEVYYGRQGSRRVYVRGLGGFLLSASSWLLWGSFFISRLFVF